MSLRRTVESLYRKHPGGFVFIVAFLLYAATASWFHILNSDVQASVPSAYQLAAEGNPWLEGLPDDSINPLSFYIRTSPFIFEANGHLVTNRQIGIVLLAVPFYWLTGSPMEVWPSALAAVMATSAGVALMHVALRALVPTAAAWGATAVMAVASPTWAVSADGLWSHTVTQLVISAAAFFAARNAWWLAGSALGFGILARPHLAVISLALGVGVGWARRSPRATIAVGIPGLLSVGILLWLNNWIYGRWTLTGYGSYVSRNLGVGPQAPSQSAWEYLANWIGFLVAPDRGLFVWTPIALVLLPAAWRSRRQAPDWVLALLVGGLAYTAVQLRINHFHGVDAFFGYRHGLELFTCALPLYAIAWYRTTSAAVRGVVAGLFVVQTFAMLLGAILGRGLAVSQVWTDNSLVFLLREEPRLMAPLMLLVALLAVTVGRFAATTPHLPSQDLAPKGRSSPLREGQAGPEQ